MDTVAFIEANILERYPNEKVYKSLKSALLGSIYFSEMGWHKDVVFIKGLTVKEFYTAYAGKPDFFDIPLFNPNFNRYRDDN